MHMAHETNDSTGRNYSLELKCCYFADGKFAKFKFRISLVFTDLIMKAYLV